MNTMAATAGSLPRPVSPTFNIVPDLRDLMEDGIYMLFLLRSSTAPHDAAEFSRRVDKFLTQFEHHATNFSKPQKAIQDSKYAFCALMDEIVLASDFQIREEWERNPLQLRIFGEHLAGEGFFDRLKEIRLDPQKNLETLEVYYTCLLLGFQGKYLLEGPERLGYLTARINQEIAAIRGGKSEFAPHWQPTFRFHEFVRHELPLWVYFSLLLVVAMLVFLTFTFLLGNRAKGIAGSVQPPPPACIGIHWRDLA